MSTITAGHDPDHEIDIRSLFDDLVDQPSIWLDTPNDQLGGEKPKDLFGTPREFVLRELAEAIKLGMPT